MILEGLSANIPNKHRQCFHDKQAYSTMDLEGLGYDGEMEKYRSHSCEEVNLMKQVPKTVISLGFVSFFTDLSSEIIYPLLPIFLSSVLRAGAIALGIIEGIPFPCNNLDDLFSLIVQLSSTQSGVFLKLLKDPDIEPIPDIMLRLDPNNFLAME